MGSGRRCGGEEGVNEGEAEPRQKLTYSLRKGGAVHNKEEERCLLREIRELTTRGLKGIWLNDTAFQLWIYKYPFG